MADTSIALTRYPEGAIPPTRAMADLPMRVLLVLSEPAGASPIFPHLARQELLHGLRALDEAGAVIVDLLRPPTYEVLVEAVTNGGYHLLVFYGHGVYDEDAGGGCLLFEDEFGGPDLVPATELGAALRNTDVRHGPDGGLPVGADGGIGPVGRGRPGPAAGGRAAGGGHAGLDARRRGPGLYPAVRPLAGGGQARCRGGGPGAQAAGARGNTATPGSSRRCTAARRPARVLWAGYRLFDPALPLPEETEDARAEMQARRTEIAALETAIGQIGMLARPAEIAGLREARAAFAQRPGGDLARRTPGGYAAVTSPLYGVPSNPVFVGRVPELREVSEELAGEQPVVIWGAGGIGKTALAIEVAHRQSWRFPGGVLWLDCRGGPAWDSLLDRIGGFCGIAGMEQVPPGEKETLVRRALAGLGERCLLVWDNAEDVWAVPEVRRLCGQPAAQLPGAAHHARGPPAGHVAHLELRPLVDEAMRELFHRLAGAARVKVGGQADLDCIPQIISHLEGHPLALTLIVPLAKARGLLRTWRDLERRPPRGVEAAFELSYERLSWVQQRLFARLSVLTIPFEWEAAEALLPGEEPPAMPSMSWSVAPWSPLMALATPTMPCCASTPTPSCRSTEDPRPVHRLAAEYLNAKLKGEGGTPEEALEEVDQWQQAEEWEQFALCVPAPWSAAWTGWATGARSGSGWRRRGPQCSSTWRSGLSWRLFC